MSISDDANGSVSFYQMNNKSIAETDRLYLIIVNESEECPIYKLLQPCQYSHHLDIYLYTD